MYVRVSIIEERKEGEKEKECNQFQTPVIPSLLFSKRLAFYLFIPPLFYQTSNSTPFILDRRYEVTL